MLKDIEKQGGVSGEGTVVRMSIQQRYGFTGCAQQKIFPVHGSAVGWR